MRLKLKYFAVTCVLFVSAISLAGTAQASQMLPSDMTAIPASTYVKSVQSYQVAQNSTARISTAKAKSIARNHVRGAKDVLDVTLRGDVYIVRVEKQGGRIVDVMVDAATGRVR